MFQIKSKSSSYQSNWGPVGTAGPGPAEGLCHSLVTTCPRPQRGAPCPGLGLLLCPLAAQLLGMVVGWSLSARPCHDGPHGEPPYAPSIPAHKESSTLAVSSHFCGILQRKPYSSLGSQIVFSFTSLPPTDCFMGRVTDFRVGLTIYLLCLKILSSAGSVGFKSFKPQVWPRQIFYCV